MPFVTAQDEELKKQQEGAGTNISGQSTSFNVPGQDAGGSTGAASSGPKSSGQYQNIQKYLQANQSQGQQMGQEIASSVGQKVSGAQQAGESLKGSVQKVSAYDPTKILSNLPQATEEEKKTYQSTKQSGGYTGPSEATGLSGYTDWQKANEAAKTSVGQTETEAGQRELLKNQYARPNYSGGAVSLDQTLLAQSQGGKQALSNVGQTYKPLLSAIGSAGTEAQSAIEQSQAQAQANKALFNPAEQQARESIWNPISERAKQLNISEPQKYQNTLSDLADLNLRPETLAALGLNAGDRTFGLNLQNYLSGPTSQATVQNVATTQEREKYNQLLDFLGANTQELGLGSPLYQGMTVDKAKLAADIAGRKGEYETFAKGKNYLANFGNVSAGNSAEDLFNAAEHGNVAIGGNVSQNTSNLYDIMAAGGPEAYVNSLNMPGFTLQNKQALLDQIKADLNQFGYQNLIGLEG